MPGPGECERCRLLQLPQPSCQPRSHVSLFPAQPTPHWALFDCRAFSHRPHFFHGWGLNRIELDHQLQKALHWDSVNSRELIPICYILGGLELTVFVHISIQNALNVHGRFCIGVWDVTLITHRLDSVHSTMGLRRKLNHRVRLLF